MALDGSFSLECAVKRFVARCPELGRVKKFDDLLKKEHMITEEEVVNLMVEIFPNPNFTIPLIGCFQPIAHKIVDKAVALFCQCDLKSNVDDMDTEPGHSVDKEFVYLIDYYNQNGRGVKLHEFACLAFCRAVDLDPSLWRFVSTYFKFAPQPFQRILRSHTVNELSKVVSQYLLAVRVSYRLLLMEPEFFSHCWDWSCFLDLVDTINSNQENRAELEKDIADIRWCGVQILSVIFKMNDRAIEKFGIGVDEAASCLLRWEEFCQDVVMEKVGSYIISSEDAKLRGFDLGQQKCLNSFNYNSPISLQLHEVEPVIKSPRLAAWNANSAGNLFVVTPTIKKSFEMVLLAVSQKWPVLLYGPAGSGKTALVSKLAWDARSEVLSIHMDDQIDGKTLIGSYVCTEKPGEFRWQPGSLVQAVLNGYWVVFEDIDKASPDVQSILLPLLEGASSFVTSHGEEIRVAESFRLFSTISVCKNDVSRSAEGGSLLSILWRRVMIGLPNNDDLQIILKARYPDLEPLAGKLVETLEKVNSVFYGSSIRFSLRDLLKWCKRIARFCFSYINNMLTADQSRCIYQEAVDIFAAQLMSAENRMTIMKDIERLWAVPVTDAGILHPYKPEIQVSPLEVRVGRVTLQSSEAALRGQKNLVKMRSSLHILERIACSVKYNEPVLLVGETGTGKTTLVQNLAMMLGQRLTVLNLSQQSDVADLLGGFKPMEPQSICVLLYKEFIRLFSKTFSVKENDKLFAYLQKQLSTRNWMTLLNGFKKYVDNFQKKVQIEKFGSGKKRKKPLNELENLTAWENFSVKLEAARGQLGASSGMIFSFIEGAFITALRNGEWILLDEVNLAPPETLQRLVGVLEGEHGSLCLAERGDASYIARHPNFRIFACMNPATDAGKRDLPHSLQSRFTEYFVDDVLDNEDLRLFIQRFLEESRSDSKIVEKIIDFYGASKKSSEERLQDGANQKPQYSLRSLYRALEFTDKAKGKFGFQKAMYDGFSMFFLTLLDKSSNKIMKKMIKEKLLGGNKPSSMPFDAYLRVKKDSTSDDFLENYVLTKSVKKQLENLARAVFIKKYPVLLQGPTSSGKTSLVQYLAARTGHEFVRINNHEHTDLQEYLGSYISDAYGKLIFHEGALVKAVRNGYWIVLDELNLAPSDVLEALNRLLDDNRELYVPELRETIRAHPNFMLFATQNPPTIYGGRKMLSRAFRNRFVEVHVDEIPDHELSTIVEKRGKIPASRAKLMVEVMKELQLLRQSSKVFAGKHGFITPRDLFRWANRLRTFGFSKEIMAEHGYYLLAERLRDEGEMSIVQEVLEKLIHVKIVKEDLYKEVVGRNHKSIGKELDSFGHVILTRSMRRLFFLVKCCYELREPVLLVGETGGGKTTVCQLLSTALGAKLHILNCHQYTETSDFLGGFYPIRERSRLMSEFKHVTEKLMLSKAFIHFPHDMMQGISSDIGQASLTLDHLALMSTTYRQGRVSCLAVTTDDLDIFDQMMSELIQLHQKWQTIFMWQDGPLVQAMKAGDLFLVDEISLADDSVLERLNSVLEPERKLSLAEKGGSVMEEITAHENFFVLATMNPGGDYGKKELSPALRNRFTEIWVPPVSDLDELKDIASKRLVNPELTRIVDAMLNFWEWFNQLQTGKMLTVRDLLSWIEFVNVTNSSLGPDNAFLHGLFLVLLDGLCLGTGISKEDASQWMEKCLSFLLKLLKLDDTKLPNMENYGWADHRLTADSSSSDDMICDNVFGIHPFYIEKGYGECHVRGFEFLAPTTRRNALRVLRAMQLPKPVLLEGSPGVGKTSLVMALGKYSGHKVVRINLSEQTDLMDLLGSDLPVDSDEGMKFAWSDGILLQALKEGCWVLLDELNLAPQSVLEGLNAILDHRAEVFIPELGLTFKCPPSFRIFACQNPFSQGGGRKGLPRSFLNRFTKVYIDELAEDDYLFISSSLYPSIPRPVLSKLILFNKRLHEEIMLYHKFAQNGSPWEFNLRDVLRSCQIIQGAPEESKSDSFVNILYVQRMRAAADRQQVLQLYEEVFGEKPSINPYPRVQLDPEYLSVGTSAIKRSSFQSWSPLNSQLNIMPYIRHSLEAVAHSVQHQWLCILVGPPSSGKTSLIRLLAQLTGNVLNEVNLSSTTDISELLGCFEQYNAYRNIRLIVAQVERYLNQYFSLQLEFSKAAFVSERKGIIAKWFAFLSTMDSGLSSTSTFSYLQKGGNIVKSLCLLVDIIEQLKSDVENRDLHVSGSTEELDRMKAILELQIDQKKEPFSAKFEWVSGLLIKAIENGEWLVLENANLCNPTVLDRINSLVEPGGSITINERGIVDGSPMVILPHPNFRMFLTVNPSYGEVSRAMRNRGVEIFMMQPYWLLDETSDCSCAEFELKDVKRFLVLSGIPFVKLVDSMAEAHLYARNEGQKINVQVTYLELARWIQLFQQLIRKGNETLWSLQISWEHTYLSSLGEAVGCEIINYAKVSYLSRATLLTSDLPVEFSLYLPGGWPVPLKVRDFIWYSRETSVKQNCIYLEYLVAQCELGETQIGGFLDQILSITGHEGSSLIDVKTTHSDWLVSSSCGNSIFDWKLINKMIFFATNWAIEQAHDRDYNLYFLCFDRLSSKLRHYNNFFSSFFNTLKQEVVHPIWKHIFCCQHKLSSLHQVDWNLQLLMLSYQQWNAQSAYEYGTEARHFKPVFKSLQMLEREILDMLAQSPSYDVLSKLYSDLLEDHLFFWDTFVSSQVDPLLIAWHSLIKDISRLRDFCPRAVENVLLMASKNLKKVFSQRSEQSLLWIYGGHPILPASEKLYHVQGQFLDLCESIWLTRKNKFKQVDDDFIQVVASSNHELRFLALQGICMSLYITTSKSQEEIVQFVQQLEEMGQMLLERLQYEKHKLDMKLQSDKHALVNENLASCCVFPPEILCTSSGFVSWQEVIPIMDATSLFLDRKLLQKLSSIVLVDPSELQLALHDISNLLEFALKFSVTSSTRPPQNFVPHQKILWTLDAWTGVDAANGKITSYVLEMWSCWHSSLWSHCPEFVKNLSMIGGHDLPQPDMLIQPIGTATVCQILKSTCAIRDYFLHSLKLKVASCNFWQSCPPGTSLDNFLLSVGRSLFEQIIYVHEKAFNHNKFAIIKSIFCSFQNTVATEEDIQQLSSLIASSSHQGLKSSLELYIKPVLRELYLPSSSSGLHLNIGYAWLWIGGLRFNLLLSCNNLDPAMKYSCKYAQLEGKISSLQLEIKVREECNYIAGWSSSRGADKNRSEALERLKAERQRLQRKMVFRCNPLKYSALRKECEEFLKLVLAVVNFVNGIEVMELQEVLYYLCNWQETAISFIDLLADEYKDYSDVAQPFQVAVYEMKLGLSLLLSGVLQKKFLNHNEQDNMDQVTESIYSFMRFPGGFALKSISFDSTDVPTNFWELETGLVEKLVPISRDDNSEKEVGLPKYSLCGSFNWALSGCSWKLFSFSTEKFFQYIILSV
uniref:Midasin n=1 Tax=Rhizophora mucronata TaxID=61149 RepID=A0A2P2MUR2_RHIMU